jgi:glycosyltransferase involved in cell wall biosynthesis
MIAPFPIDPGDIKGGVEAITVNLVNGFGQTAIADLHILSIQPSIVVSETRRVAPHVQVTYLPQGRGNKRIGMLFSVRKQVRKMISKLKPDIVHIQGNGPQLLVTIGLDKANLIITRHGVITEELKNQLSLKSRMIYRVNSWTEHFCSRSIRNYIFISRYIQSLSLPGTQKNRLSCLIANPVNPAFFSVPASDFSGNRILFVGGIRKGKGLLDLLKAVLQLNQKGIRYEVEVVGGVVEPAYNEQVTAFISSNGLDNHVHFNDWISQERIIALYENIQLLVLPSLQENLPVCIAEAMAAQRVVVSSAVGGVPEMIEHGKNGFLFAKENVSELAELLRMLDRQPELRSRVAAEAKRHALETYDPEAVALQTVHFYQSVIDRR